MRVCVIHATAGAGHKKAAEAIYQGLVTDGQDARIIDALDYTNPFFKATYPSTYSFLVTKLPFVWAFFFGLLNIPWLQPAVKLFRRVYNGLNARMLEKFLIDEKFDCVIVTQFLSAEVSAYLKRTGKIRSKVICVVTDFDVHRIWVNRGIDIYTGASPYTKEKLIALGVHPDKVFATGIPTLAEFRDAADLAQLKAQFKLFPQSMTVLIATGSFGMGPIEALIDGLKGYHVLVVCGHNRELYDRLKGRASSHVHIFGLVKNMHELMTVADVMVTKPGGLSIAEALVKHLPMLFFSAIPGQEIQNIAVLKKYGVASDQMDVSAIINAVDDLYASPENLEKLRLAAASMAKPSAVKDIISLI